MLQLFIAVMRYYLIVIIFFLLPLHMLAQASFNDGWHTHKTRNIIKQYNYKFDCKNDMHPWLTDSSYTFVSNDSTVTLQIVYPVRATALYKTATTLGKNKLPVKTEKYKETAMVSVNEWKYDAKNRVISHTESDKLKDREYTEKYEYGTDKTSGGLLTTETSYFNGRVEFYTMSYYDKKGRKYKEVRLNDNRKDIIHVDGYVYNEDGRIKEKSTFFPEFRVTKKFKVGNEAAYDKCYKVVPNEMQNVLGVTKDFLAGKLLEEYKTALQDDDCNELEYRLINKFYKAEINKSTFEKKNTLAIITVQNYY